METETGHEEVISRNFIERIIDEDLAQGTHGGKVVTRFPPEPNGYLHIGHAKSICLNFGLAQQYGGVCHLRFDDTNPAKEEVEYIESIKRDIAWLGFTWDGYEFYASDYFEILHTIALKLIAEGKAYVDELSPEQVRTYRGTLKEPGVNSPYRDRSIEENLRLFSEMKDGKHAEGTLFLRAKIDMASPNLNMRDPSLYRIKHTMHHRTGDAWSIYPMYDFTHPLSDALEKITHSICTLEFEDHRPLYDWIVAASGLPDVPHQYEFARLNLNYTVMSKRLLLQLVKDGHVSGWDDPRMPTISGLRRRGYSPQAIRDFAGRIGVSKTNSVVDFALLDHCLREDLNTRARRVMAVIDPLKVVITNYPEDTTEYIEADNNPEDPSAGKRQIPFTRELYIEQDDFMENPPRKYFRLSPGREIRLKHAYYITCDEVIRAEDGSIIELRCTYDPDSRGGWTADERKVKGTSHWVSAVHALPAAVRLYDKLFTAEFPGEKTGNFLDDINPDSVRELSGCMVEPSLAQAVPGDYLQFMRTGYFCVDSVDSSPDALVFNRTIPLRDSWAKLKKKMGI
ncbi:MAG: glutamine--tRNA ligase/YqeY domain fusion protein [Spirochaetia bacterium]|nr:glutamine--tRNA ligase/YqeY domain fusion protein [Spirochaetia bacterium]